MSESHAALDRLKSAYAAWDAKKGDSIPTWLDLLSEELDFRSLANGVSGLPWTRTHTSPAGVRSYLEGLTSGFRMEHFTVERYICEGDTIVVIAHCAWTNKETGKRVDTPKVDIWRFKDGKATAFHEFYDTAQVVASMTA